MKKLLTLFLAFSLTSNLFSQESSFLKVETYQLPNGFTVFLNQDETISRVYGAVMVNAGAKHEDPEATGMAHYLEHLLFKGTAKLGTSDYEKEKPFLDSINVLYDELAKAQAADQKLAIQKQINEQALSASKYGLPNEFDKLLKSIGSTGINAFTNYEMTFYHNSFPAHEIERWLDIYAERFQDPVFRSFQSELEVVYEEKNRSLDNFQRRIVERLGKIVFKGLPYGEWSVLGDVEHLKNPSINKMYDFFEKHYVANNMALILTGNFDPDIVKPIIARKFSPLKRGEVTPPSFPTLEAFDGLEKYHQRMTPVKVGITNYRTVPLGHPDREALDVFEYILSNQSGTGLLDRLVQNNEMLAAGAISSVFNDAGSFSVFYVPKILIGSLKGTEKKILRQVAHINNGTFDVALLKIAKKELQRDFKERLANVESRGRMIGNAFNQGVDWEDYIAYPDRVASVTMEDLQRVGQQYIGKNRMKFISRTGFPKKNKLKKPPYKPIVTEQNQNSSYAEKFEKITPLPFQPQFLDYQQSIERSVLPGGHELYVSKNEKNDLFTLQMRFKTGRFHDKRNPIMANLLSYAGAGAYDQLSFRKKMATIGLDCRIWADNNYVVFNLEGQESSLEEGLSLLHLLMTDPKIGEKTKKILLNEVSGERKIEKRDPNFLGRALFDYGVLKDQSPNINRLSKAEIKKIDPSAYTKRVIALTGQYGAEIIFYGQKNLSALKGLLEKTLPLSTSSKVEQFTYSEPAQITKNKILLLHDKKAVQTQMYFYVRGDRFEQKDYAVKNAFNQYFSGGFSGLVLQEIREYRSLAYSAGANYNEPLIPNREGRFYAFVGCQSDKTNDAVEVMMDLLRNMPEKADRMDALRSNMQLKVITEFPAPDDMPYQIIAQERRGYQEDPNKKAYETYQALEMDDLVEFYERSIKGRPIMITIYGDKRNIDIAKLKQIGEVIEVKKSDIATY